MDETLDYNAVASLLEKGGSVAANVPTQSAMECLEFLQHQSGEFGDQLKVLLPMSDDVTEFQPFDNLRHFYEKFFVEGSSTEYPRMHIHAHKPCFTRLDKGSTPQHDVGLQIFIGYDEIREKEGDRWIRVITVNPMDDYYREHNFRGKKRELIQSHHARKTFPLSELQKICPQATADVHRAFQKIEDEIAQAKELQMADS